MLIPIGTDRRQQHTPWVNYTIIAVNVVAFIIQQYVDGQAIAAGATIYDPLPTDPYLFHPLNPRMYQFITSTFMHADWMHLAGNMLFLFVFGNAVEDRLGKVAYLSYYLAAGVLACLAHGLTDVHPSLGASGAIAGVTGAFAVLMPNARVSMIYIIFFIGRFEVSAIFLVLFYMAMDLFFFSTGGGNVAYTAHLGGYAVGFGVMISLLYLRILPQDEWDLLALIKHRKRKHDFKRMANKGFRPWEMDRSKGVAAGTRPGQSASVQGEPDETQKQLMAVRARIASAVANHRMDEGAELYAGLLNMDPSQTMSQQHQLDLANHLMSQQDHATAAQAYELFLKAYRTHPRKVEVELMLGLIYARYLNNAARARELLDTVRHKLPEGPQKQMAEQTLADLG